MNANISGLLRGQKVELGLCYSRKITRTHVFFSLSPRALSLIHHQQNASQNSHKTRTDVS